MASPHLYKCCHRFTEYKVGFPGKTLLIKMWKFHFVSSANVMPVRLTGPNWLITRLNVFLVALKIRSILIYTFVIKPKHYLHTSGLLTAYNADRLFWSRRRSVSSADLWQSTASEDNSQKVQVFRGRTHHFCHT